MPCPIICPKIIEFNLISVFRRPVSISNVLLLLVETCDKILVLLARKFPEFLRRRRSINSIIMSSRNKITPPIAPPAMAALEDAAELG